MDNISPLYVAAATVAAFMGLDPTSRNNMKLNHNYEMWLKKKLNKNKS